jgi:hypothetical protein
MPHVWVYERASERLCTVSGERVVMMVITEDGSTRWRSFGTEEAFRPSGRTLRRRSVLSGGSRQIPPDLCALSA